MHDVTYYLNRSRDGGVTWDFNGSSAVGGILVASGVSSQLDNAGTQASNNWFAGVNDLRGNITAIASDKAGSHIYVLYGAQDNTGTDRIYLEEFHPLEPTWSRPPRSLYRLHPSARHCPRSPSRMTGRS